MCLCAQEELGGHSYLNKMSALKWRLHASWLRHVLFKRRKKTLCFKSAPCAQRVQNSRVHHALKGKDEGFMLQECDMHLKALCFVSASSALKIHDSRVCHVLKGFILQECAMHFLRDKGSFIVLKCSSLFESLLHCFEVHSKDPCYSKVCFFTEHLKCSSLFWSALCFFEVNSGLGGCNLIQQWLLVHLESTFH